MNYFFHPDAEAEFEYAIDYYENCSSGLGYDFSIEIHSVIKRICFFPKAWPLLVDEVRRCQANRFPFGVLYIEEKASIQIIAVMHLHRAPAYWQEELDHFFSKLIQQYQVLPLEELIGRPIMVRREVSC